MIEPGARVVLDSVSPAGMRLTTLEVVMHRFVLAEFNTHRVFSRNSASSRAIPVEKQLAKVSREPAWPLVWAREQPGMQGGDELEGLDLKRASELFSDVWEYTTTRIQAYLAIVAADYGPDPNEVKLHRLHKSLLNRLLEPFMWHTVIVTATDFENFFNLRCSPLAQPEIRAAAEAMEVAYRQSTPSLIGQGDYHTPYILPSEYTTMSLYERQRVSVARCARVSVLTHDGIRDMAEDMRFFGRLSSADPMHASPMEHVATPCLCTGWDHVGNFYGWDQFRHQIEAGNRHKEISTDA